MTHDLSARSQSAAQDVPAPPPPEPNVTRSKARLPKKTLIALVAVVVVAGVVGAYLHYEKEQQRAAAEKQRQAEVAEEQRAAAEVAKKLEEGARLRGDYLVDRYLAAAVKWKELDKERFDYMIKSSSSEADKAFEKDMTDAKRALGRAPCLGAPASNRRSRPRSCGPQSAARPSRIAGAG